MESAIELAVVKVLGVGKVAGTGFFVSEQYIITCAHVVAYALGIEPNSKKKPPQTVEVNLPIDINNEENIKTEVEVWYPVDSRKTIEDIAVLKLIEQPPEIVRPIVLVSSAEELGGHEFKTFGFPPNNPEKPELGARGAIAQGIIAGRIPPKWVQIEKIRGQGYPLEPGFSGAPIWDKQLGGVVGMAVARDARRPNAEVGFMIPTENLVKAWSKLQEIGCWLGREKEEQIISILQPHYLHLKSEIQWAYRQASSKTNQEVPEVLSEMVQDLEKNNSSQEPHHSSLDQFVMDLFIRLEKSSVSEESNLSDEFFGQLQTWLKNYIEPLEEFRENRLNNYEKIKTEQACLLLAIDKNIDNQYGAKVWLIEDVKNYKHIYWEKCHPLIQNCKIQQNQRGIVWEDLAKIINLGLESAKLYCLNNPEKIHIFLPNNLLNYQVEYCSLNEQDEDTKLGMEYEVAIRFIERLKGINESIELWKKKGTEMRNELTKNTIEVFSSIDKVLDSVDLRIGIKKIEKKLKLNQKLFAWKLSNSMAQDSSQQRQVFELLLATGIPIALWTRHQKFNCESDLANYIDRELKLQELPTKIKDCRLDAYGEDYDCHIGHHLCLLWDDPDLIPPKSQLQMPKL